MAALTKVRPPEEQQQCKAMAVTAAVVLALFLAIFTSLLGAFGFFAVLIIVGVTVAGMVCLEYSGWFDKTRKHPR